jgi:hypothetical protein
MIAEAAANGDDVALADAPTIAAAAKRLRVQPQAAEAMRLRAGLLANAKYDDLPANVGTDPSFSSPAPQQGRRRSGRGILCWAIETLDNAGDLPHSATTEARQNNRTEGGNPCAKC